MITVHLILNAHIDPVWLWPWPAGLDEALATCRSACERLDAHPDLTFTRGEAWVYDAVERADPALFARIRAHIDAGRWEIVGGWWVQPDCNLPTAAGLRRQIELGRDYFASRFGRFPRIGFNVDSFGHAAALPGLMRSYGQDRYVMMRPQEHEKALPARLFRWRGAEGGEEVTSFRIAREYATQAITEDHVRASLEGLPDGVTHTMCFIGLGDHGGGPTERQIAWCREHAFAFDGARLTFSSPSRFFDAVEAEGVAPPVVTGELQHHAVGCYSVLRDIKLGVRRAEEALQQAEIVSAADPAPEPGTAARLTQAWKDVCFNHFHDTLGGTIIASAAADARDQLGAARASADEVIQFGLRRMLASLPDSGRQRIALFNASDHAYDGYAVLAPWTEARWEAHWRLRDGAGAVVPHQPVAQAPATAFPRRLLVRVEVPPRRLTTLLIDRGDPDAETTPRPRTERETVAPAELALDGAARVVFGDRAEAQLPGGVGFAPRLELFEDPTDTWSHGVDRLGAERLGEASWEAPILVDRGPLMTSALQRGRLGASDLLAEWRVYAGEPVVELLLRVHWHAAHKLMKLSLPLPIEGHLDGVMSGALARDLDGAERPLRDFTRLSLPGGGALGVVCPEVFALDASPQGARLTLLRSPLMAHHDPAQAADFPRALHADQGVHEFRFQFAAFDGLSVDWLEQRAAMLHRPLIAADLTRGMPARSDG